MTANDLSEWLTKVQAAAAIRVSTKQVERLQQAGKLEMRGRPQERGPNLVVYNPDDVARIAKERHPDPPPFVLPAIPPANGNGKRTNGPTVESTALTIGELPAVSLDDFHALVALALRTVLSQTSETSAVSEALWVTVKEAAAILGFPQADVRRLCHDGDLNHRLTGRGGIRIRRRDLEAF